MNARLTMLVAGVGAALALATVALAASAGPPGRWTQISHFPARVGLARGHDGTLHVLWAGPTKIPFSAVYDTPIPPSGAVGPAKPVVTGWKAANPPAAAVAADGSIHAVVSGTPTGSVTDPHAGLNELVGPGSWQLGAHAFGCCNAAYADVQSAFLRDGRLASVWVSASRLHFQVGTDPDAAAAQDVTPPGFATNPSLVVDPASGAAVIAYHGAGGFDYFRQVAPSLGQPRRIGAGNVDVPMIAARSTGGVYGAVLHVPDWTKVTLVRFGGPSRTMPMPKGAQAFSAGVAAGPEGRLWVYSADRERLYVTRTNKAVTAFEPVQTLRFPGALGAAAVLEGEGSTGPLDLLAALTFYNARDGAWHTQVRPQLSLSVSKRSVGKRVQLLVRVVDAGDPVGGATVTGLPGGPKRTGANGTIVVAASKGTFALTATKPGYLAAKGRVSL